MTPAIVFLKKKKVSFDIHQYQHEAGAASYGIEAAQKLGIEQQQVFKTIVLETDQKKLIVAIVPVDNQVNLKKLAKKNATPLAFGAGLGLGVLED